MSSATSSSPAPSWSFGKQIVWRSLPPTPIGSKGSIEASLRDGRHLYHMLRWTFAQKILDDSTIRLSPVGDWKDPYERWWCELLFGASGPLLGLNAYGLCLTTGAHDEPRWRMAAYGHGGEPIVRLRTSPRRLAYAIGQLGETRLGAGFLAPVRYRKTDWLLAYARSIPSAKAVTRTAAEMLMRKRTAFKFESEVRLLWLDKAPPENALFVDIRGDTIFDQVMVSPYVPVVERDKIEAYCRSRGLLCERSSVLAVPKI